MSRYSSHQPRLRSPVMASSASIGSDPCTIGAGHGAHAVRAHAETAHLDVAELAGLVPRRSAASVAVIPARSRSLRSSVPSRVRHAGRPCPPCSTLLRNSGVVVTHTSGSLKNSGIWQRLYAEP